MRIKAITNPQDTRQADYIKFLEKEFPQILTEENPELYYVIGGDGAMHYANSDYPDADIPFFGKGFGTLNFIMNNFDNDREVIQKLLNDEIELSVIEFNKMEVIVEHPNGETYVKKAINDVVIGNRIMDWHTFVINSERGAFDALEYTGMGICLTTPLGSTAFNINNYGKVLPLDAKMWSITSVVGDHRINEVMMEQEMDIEIKSQRQTPSVFIDGTATEIGLSFGSKIKIKSSEKTFKIAFLDEKDFHLKRMKLIQKKRAG